MFEHGAAVRLQQHDQHAVLDDARTVEQARHGLERFAAGIGAHVAHTVGDAQVELVEQRGDVRHHRIEQHEQRGVATVSQTGLDIRRDDIQCRLEPSPAPAADPDTARHRASHRSAAATRLACGTRPPRSAPGIWHRPRESGGARTPAVCARPHPAPLSGNSTSSPIFGCSACHAASCSSSRRSSISGR